MNAIRLGLGAALLALLAACGVEGPPTAPERSSISVTGEASFGVVGEF